LFGLRASRLKKPVSARREEFPETIMTHMTGITLLDEDGIMLLDKDGNVVLDTIADPVFVSPDLDLEPFVAQALSRFGVARDGQIDIYDHDGAIVATYRNGGTAIKVSTP
jgi:hypothetical protein